MRRRSTHVAVGNLNIDIYIYVKEYPCRGGVSVAQDLYADAGGAAANYCYACAMAGCTPRLVAHTGPLAAKLGLIDKLRSVGVDVSGVVVHDDEEPGIVVVVVDDEGENTMIKFVGANRRLRGDEVRRCLPADVLHLASVGLEVVKRAVEASEGLVEHVSYDPGTALAVSSDTPSLDILRMVSLVSINMKELRVLLGGTEWRDARLLLGGRLAYVVVRMGRDGAVCVTRDYAYIAKAYKYGLVTDTTGAGDTFNAYLNTFIAEGRSVDEALAAATIAAGVKVTRRGAQAAPPRDLVEELLSRAGRELVRKVPL